jgi:endonuclease G, mitochondrial
MIDKLEKAARLRAMLAQIAPGNAIESVQRPPRDNTGFESSAGFESLDAGPSPADVALQKLAENRPHEVTDDEMSVLEAIVMPQNRPVVFVRGGSYDNVDDPWLKLNDPGIKTRISPLLSYIGRIEAPNLPQVPFVGTGFVVGKGLMMTNRHVAKLVSTGLGLRIVYSAGNSAVDFKRQIDTPDSDRSAYMVVRGVAMVHPYWDMALLNVEGVGEDKMLKLCVTSPEDLVGRDVVVVGYPAKDWRNDVALQDRIFAGQYNVKRLQPGTVRPRAKVQSFENVVNAMTHDASTLGGNSGSAIIDVNNGDVLALHFAGEYLKANYAVPMYELARDRRVVASKLNFEGQLSPTNDWEPAWLSTEGDEAAAGAQPAAPKTSQPVVTPVSPHSPAPLVPVPVNPTPAAPPPTRVSPNYAAASHTATWTIPIHINISVGAPVESEPAPAAPPAPLSSSAVEAEEAVVVDQDYSTRPGYDPDFLDGVAVPLPAITKAMQQDTAQVPSSAQVHDDPFELAYYHYSVYMNKKRRTAWFSAANVDGDNRPAIGKRAGDRWYRDTRIQKSEQLGQEAFESGIDRGHLTRREDTAWGKDVDDATAANNDTFHFTNCSLQASPFNRGKDRWQGLEQFLLEKHAKKDKRRMTVITGPLFAANDPVYKNDKMNYSVRCPIQFWKVCVLVREDGTPSATGFILGQEDIKDLPGFEEAFEVAATQIKISDLEKKTGLSFGDLKKHDHFAEGGDPGTIEAPTGVEGVTQTVKAIRTAADIVV